MPHGTFLRESATYYIGVKNVWADLREKLFSITPSFLSRQLLFDSMEDYCVSGVSSL